MEWFFSSIVSNHCCFQSFFAYPSPGCGPPAGGEEREWNARPLAPRARAHTHTLQHARIPRPPLSPPGPPADVPIRNGRTGNRPSFSQSVHQQLRGGPRRKSPKASKNDAESEVKLARSKQQRKPHETKPKRRRKRRAHEGGGGADLAHRYGAGRKREKSPRSSVQTEPKGAVDSGGGGADLDEDGEDQRLLRLLQRLRVWPVGVFDQLACLTSWCV